MRGHIAGSALAGGGSSTGSGHVIQNATTPLTARANLNFTGAGVVASDNAGTDSTDVTIPGGGGATLEAITITYTGTPAQPFVVNVIQPIGVQIDDTIYTAEGKWVETMGNSITSTSFPYLGYLTLSFPDLVGVRNDFYFLPMGAEALEELTAAALEVVGGSFYIIGNTSLTSLDLSALTTTGSYCVIGGNTLLTSLDLSDLTAIGGFCLFFDLPAITSITLPAIETIVGAFSMVDDTSNMDLCTSFTLGSGLKSVGGNVTITAPTLAEASTNNVLVRLAALDGTGGTTLYTGRTVDLSGKPAPPSATGWAARLTLIAATNTVSVNGNFAITAVAATPVNTFTIAGDKATIFVASTTFVIAGSTGNDGTYTVVTSVYGTSTVITVSEAVPDTTADGTITKITG